MSFSLTALLFWRDRAGRFSPLRAATLVGLLAPLGLLLWRTASGDLGARPLTEALHFCGDRAIETLIAAIAITPLRRLSATARLVDVRRMIGVASFLWAAAHLALYVVDQAGDLGKVAGEIAVRPYLLIGFVALIGLAALAATSTDRMIRRLGGPRWNRLHGLVHPIAILALVHVFLQVRLDPGWAAIVAGLATGGLAVRVAGRDGGGASGLAGATIAAWIGAAASELVWFAIKTKRPIAPIALANFDTSFRIAPSWWAAGLLALIGLTALAWRWRSQKRYT
ncbi:MAG: ferric reductase-like transmembrane domain-containing protein [Hyphomicrobiales bacterium]|nr:ferric reductase-like transmembrane domain-containing protein [Hyphomicrobiales bacterium]